MSTIQRILIPTDFDESTEQFLRRARKLAERYPTELHLLHIIPRPRLPRALGEDPESRLRAARHQLELLAQPLEIDGLTVVSEIRSGRPAQEIVSYALAKDVDEIAIVTHGRTGLAHAVLGSVAEQVIRQAPCSVLVFRSPRGEPEIDRLRLVEAAELLAAKSTSELTGSYEETWDRMVSMLVRDLHCGLPDASDRLGTLKSLEVLIWNENTAPNSEPSDLHWAIDIESLKSLPATASTPEGTETGVEERLSMALDLLQRALEARASDVHLDPKADDRYEVRFRIDGRIEHYCELDSGIAAPLLQQFKVLAGLDIANPFAPMEGRLQLPAGLPDAAVRITTAPVQGGTAMALRILRRDRALMPLEGLGLSSAARDAVSRMLHAGGGLVLVTGPTGSGKTTTIHSLLNLLTSQGRNIVSIEDPIEFPLPFVRQLGVDPKHDVTMTQALRTILRMDPDIIHVSEIRDVEAAEIAMRAASSGRFVFSTLHTRDVASTVTAMRDLHIDNRSLAGNLTGIISQRLVRRLCPECAACRPITDAEAARFRAEEVELPAELRRSAGCTHCRGTGYHDRIGIFETALTHGPAETAIENGAPEDELRTVLRSSGTPSLMADALMKVRDGVTSLEEAEAMKWI
jgi:general secretion pathway protein E